MEISKQLQEILVQINNELAPQDRISEQEIAAVGCELNEMLTLATQQAGTQLQSSAPPRTFKEKLAALWQAIKDKISAWLSPVAPQWARFMNALRWKLQELQSRSGNEKLIAAGMLAVGIAVAAVLVHSMPMLIALLAILGVTSLVNLAQRITRIPGMI